MTSVVVAPEGRAAFQLERLGKANGAVHLCEDQEVPVAH